MEHDDQEVRKKAAQIRIGEDLDLLSVEELNKRINILEAEIDRIRGEIEAKLRVKDDAAAIFRS